MLVLFNNHHDRDKEPVSFTCQLASACVRVVTHVTAVAGILHSISQTVFKFVQTT
jgi:hypothetical protein